MLTVLTYNILNGGRRREDALRTIIATVRPDVVLLQEVFDSDLLIQLAQALQLEFVFLARGNSRFHLGLISRYPILTAHSYRGPPIRTAFLEATILLPSNQHLHLWGARSRTISRPGIPFVLC